MSNENEITVKIDTKLLTNNECKTGIEHEISMEIILDFDFAMVLLHAKSIDERIDDEGVIINRKKRGMFKSKLYFSKFAHNVKILIEDCNTMAYGSNTVGCIRFKSPEDFRLFKTLFHSNPKLIYEILKSYVINRVKEL